MDSLTLVRRELLRLVRSGKHSICINTRRVAALYNVSERSVRREVAKLAEEKGVRLAGWDGQEVRPIDAWRSANDFVECELGDGHVLLDIGER